MMAKEKWATWDRSGWLRFWNYFHAAVGIRKEADLIRGELPDVAAEMDRISDHLDRMALSIRDEYEPDPPIKWEIH